MTGFRLRLSGSDRRDVFGLGALAPFAAGELHFLTFFQGFEAFHFNGTKMHEHVGFPFALDETIAFLFIESFDGPSHLV